MKKINYIQNSLFKEENGVKKIIIEDKDISLFKDEESKLKKHVTFFNGNEIFVINTQGFSEGTVSILDDTKQIALFINQKNKRKKMLALNLNFLNK